MVCEEFSLIKITSTKYREDKRSQTRLEIQRAAVAFLSCTVILCANKISRPRGRTSTLVLKGCWFYSPSLLKILNPKLLLMCWSAPSMYECMCELLHVALDKTVNALESPVLSEEPHEGFNASGSICKSFIQVKCEVMDNIRYIKTHNTKL